MTEALVSRHRRDIADLVQLSHRDLDLMLQSATDAVATRQLLKSVLPDLVSVYGSASATLGADWYEEYRDALRVPGRHTARPAGLPDVGRTDSLARWATDPMFSATPDAAAALERVSGGLQRIIADADRSTVIGSSLIDPAAQGWRRMASAKACGFCRMLADREAAYTKSTVDFGAHDHCGCVAVPAFGGDVLAAQKFRRSDRKISDADKARTKAWMAANGY